MAKREHLEQNITQTEHVRPAVDLRVAPGQLRRHVKRRAVAPAGRRQHRIGISGERLHPDIRLAPDLGQAPVENDDFAESAQEYVRRLEVAMDDAAVMRVGDRLANLNQRIDQHRQRKKLRQPLVSVAQAKQDVTQVAAAHALHGEKHVTVAVAPQLINRYRAGMLQLGRHPSLAQKPLSLDLRLAHLRMQRLVHHLAMQVDVAAGEELGRATLGHQLEVGVLERATLPVNWKNTVRIRQAQRRLMQRRLIALPCFPFVAHLGAK